MKRLAKARLTWVLVAIGAVMVGMLPANAASGNAVISGTGIIVPGLTVSGGTQAWDFGGSGVIVTTTSPVFAGQMSCTVSGSDSIGTLTAGTGGFSGSCSTPCGTIGVSGQYERTVAEVTVVGGQATGCLGDIGFNGHCVFVPTTTNPITAFEAHCEFSFG